MEIIIFNGTYNTSDYKVLKNYKSIKAAQNYLTKMGCKCEIYNGLQYTLQGKTFNVSIN
jgi:hypothetical protein